ncbi:hypothetical protein FPQ18DRAFT_400987 [Pyronema domesticum]|nr:hypothetical protein FPQ18DRAFT_400987 [Pyronema domesticum]
MRTHPILRRLFLVRRKLLGKNYTRPTSSASTAYHNKTPRQGFETILRFEKLRLWENVLRGKAMTNYIAPEMMVQLGAASVAAWALYEMNRMEGRV